MNSADTDLLIIKRDALLNKKRLIDAIDKLKLNGPKSTVKFTTDCSYLTNATGIHKWLQLKNLLDGIQSENIVYFDIHEGSGAHGWGSDIVDITITERFDELAKKVRDEYHKINKQLGRDTSKFKFEDYDFHPQIKKVAQKLFEDGYYKEAILSSFIEVINRVKRVAKFPKNSRGREYDGDDLMNRVFGCDNQQPIIKLNELATDLDKAEQRGLMYLYKGICGIRDKKAHLNFIQNNPSITIEYLSLSSLLMRLLDDDYIRQYNN